MDKALASEKLLHEKMVALLVLCEKMGVDPAKNGLRGPEDKDAARQALVRLFIFAENLHDLAHKAQHETFMRDAVQLRELSRTLLELWKA